MIDHADGFLSMTPEVREPGSPMLLRPQRSVSLPLARGTLHVTRETASVEVAKPKFARSRDP